MASLAFQKKIKLKHYSIFDQLKIDAVCLEVLAQLANVEIVRPDVMTRVRTRDLTVVRKFNFSG
jgi:hypothetical protein